MSDRAARAILAAVALMASWGLVAAFPEIAYVIVGILGTCLWQRVVTWLGRRRSTEAGADVAPAADEKHETVPEALHRLAGPHVFLADFATARGLSKEAARAVLEALDIRVRRAVRNGDDTGVGVHRDDIPPLPRPPSATPAEGVDQGQPTNQPGVRIERTEGGLIIYDLADTHRHHTVGDH
ncbi:hypothetical protein [Streptomyces sp. NPDC058335]|uniref:hypothetical protein n=1 Tax=Streptomyces sp. NPDC058335 TaxID=3346451 RepID=UPI003646E399